MKQVKPIFVNKKVRDVRQVEIAERECKLCGATYQPRGLNQKYCGCQKKAG